MPFRVRHSICSSGDPLVTEHLQSSQPADSPAEGGDKKDPGKSDSAADTGRQVLLVQHRPVELHTMAQMLGLLGYRVTQAAKSADALLLFTRKRHDLVVSELDLPGLNGFRLARRIKMCAPVTRVLLMTARCQAEVAVYMDNPVVDGWIFKPFRLSTLSGVLKHITRRP